MPKTPKEEKNAMSARRGRELVKRMSSQWIRTTAAVIAFPSIGLTLSACSSANKFLGETIADLPLIGLPAGVPPRAGTPEYDAWMAKRAQDAATPKQGNAETGSDTKQ
jgi:hypothetical protein